MKHDARRTLKLAETESDRAARKICKALEAMLTNAVRALGKRNPGKHVVAISAMGAFFVHVDDEERSPAVLNTFQRIREEYGWNAIPAPLWLETTDGGITVQRRTEW